MEKMAAKHVEVVAAINSDKDILIQQNS